MPLPVCIARGIWLDSRAVASSGCAFGSPVVEQLEMFSLDVKPAGPCEICSSQCRWYDGYTCCHTLGFFLNPLFFSLSSHVKTSLSLVFVDILMCVNYGGSAGPPGTRGAWGNIKGRFGTGNFSFPVSVSLWKSYTSTLIPQQDNLLNSHVIFC